MPATVLVAAKSIVIADDTAFVRDRFQSALESAGHHTSTAATAAALLASVRSDAPNIDLVALDLRLPRAHGVELVRAVQRIEGFQGTVVVFSGTIAGADEVRALAALGVAGYVNEYTATQHILPSLVPYLFPEHHNRRSSPRVILSVPVAYRFGNTVAAAVTLNVSQGGLAIRTTSPLGLDTVVKVRFTLPGDRRDTEAEARIVWTDRSLGMGLEFVRIEGDAHSAVDDFVQTHLFSNSRA
jgi:uncharacterized protein (TIGR02266 family)